LHRTSAGRVAGRFSVDPPLLRRPVRRLQRLGSGWGCLLDERCELTGLLRLTRCLVNS